MDEQGALEAKARPKQLPRSISDQSATKRNCKCTGRSSHIRSRSSMATRNHSNCRRRHKVPRDLETQTAIETSVASVEAAVPPFTTPPVAGDISPHTRAGKGPARRGGKVAARAANPP